MIKILFLCHGNICRSPMAEFIFKSIDKDNEFVVNSKAISNEEIGNGIYPKALAKLKEKNIKVDNHIASRVTASDMEYYDYIIIMDEYNYNYLNRLHGVNDKVYKLLYFTGSEGDIEDPWYTNNFEKVYNEIYNGCLSFYNFLKK